MNCPGQPVAIGWKQEGEGRWYVVDACEVHAWQLQKRPRRELPRRPRPGGWGCGWLGRSLEDPAPLDVHEPVATSPLSRPSPGIVLPRPRWFWESVTACGPSVSR